MSNTRALVKWLLNTVNQFTSKMEKLKLLKEFHRGVSKPRGGKELGQYACSACSCQLATCVANVICVQTAKFSIPILLGDEVCDTYIKIISPSHHNCHAFQSNGIIKPSIGTLPSHVFQVRVVFRLQLWHSVCPWTSLR